MHDTLTPTKTVQAKIVSPWSFDSYGNSGILSLSFDSLSRSEISALLAACSRPERTLMVVVPEVPDHAR
jgi:hypothetical protein